LGAARVEVGAWGKGRNECGVLHSLTPDRRFFTENQEDRPKQNS